MSWKSGTVDKTHPPLVRWSMENDLFGAEIVSDAPVETPKPPPFPRKPVVVELLSRTPPAFTFSREGNLTTVWNIIVEKD